MISWNDPLQSLSGKRKLKSIESLEEQGFLEVYDLLKVTPLRLEKVPTVKSFKYAEIDSLFRGIGKVLNVRKQQNFRVFGKGRTPLANVTVIVSDYFNEGSVINLKWFNCYPSMAKKLQGLDKILFSGKVSFFGSNLQIVNPDYQELDEQTFNQPLSYWEEEKPEEVLVAYPTVGGVSPTNFKKVLDKIPNELWNQIPDKVPNEIIENHDFLNLGDVYQTLHGFHGVPTEDEKEKAYERLIFQDFFDNQIKIKHRKNIIKEKVGLPHSINQEDIKRYQKLFPYELTDDQKKVLVDIHKDLVSSQPMIRMIQGDVGSGKTSVALISALLSIQNDYQAALMCPTESLALQHFLTFKSLLKDQDIKIELLVGSLKRKEKDAINFDLKSGEIDLVIGTHALFQDSVEFKKLGLAIIDEQHKFGVNQRIKLVQKTEGAHCLIMTATPIPRSLSLTQYGDLDISTIAQMPGGRKGIKTKITHPSSFQKFLTFMKTRLSMDEQVYIVVPAIVDNVSQDILNLEETLERFKNFFPEYRIAGLHGQLKSEEKNQKFVDFKNHEIDILVSTSVIEVGINVPNATIMAILNPERFGLSSLHQLRGRVGRGEKPGFCFLVLDKKISLESKERLSVIENSTDGFKIAEEDLRIRGEGDIFGAQQSGATSKNLASLVTHHHLLEIAVQEVEKLIENDSPYISEEFKKLQSDKHVSNTI